jgi:hypothetical protein
MKNETADKLKLTVLVPDIRKSVAKILSKPKSALIGHQGWKAEQKILALWAADCAEHVLPFFEEKYPEDERPRKAIIACREWVKTSIFRMADVRKAALDAHTAARVTQEEDKDAIAAARSAGHAIATAHVPTHAFGAAAYAIKAAALHSKNAKVAITRERDWQLERLRKIAQHNI